MIRKDRTAREQSYRFFVPRKIDAGDIADTEEKYMAWLEEHIPGEGRQPCNPAKIDAGDTADTEEQYTAWLEEHVPGEGKQPCNPANLLLWTEALRSGRYELGWDGMKDYGSHNPLGVLCETYMKNTGEGKWVEAEEPRLEGLSFFEHAGRPWLSGPPPAIVDWVGLYLDGVKDLIHLIIPSFDHIADILERHPDWFFNPPEGGWEERPEAPYNPENVRLWTKALRNGDFVQATPRREDFGPELHPQGWHSRSAIHDLRRGDPKAETEDDIPNVAYSPMGVLCELYRQETGKGEWINMFYFTGSPNHGDQNDFMCEGDRGNCEPPTAIREWVGIHEAGVKTIMESVHDFKTFEETAKMLENHPERFFNTQPQ